MLENDGTSQKPAADSDPTTFDAIRFSPTILAWQSQLNWREFSGVKIG